MIGRREFITLLGGAVACPLTARAQQAQVRRIGLLHGSLPSQFTDVAFRQGLREVGFIEGQNVIIEYSLGRGELPKTARFSC